jgi:hypothetical protein
LRDAKATRSLPTTELANLSEFAQLLLPALASFRKGLFRALLAAKHDDAEKRDRKYGANYSNC